MKAPNPKRLVCIFAHPDDEAFGPGGSIAYFCANGVDVTIISVTNGDSDPRFSGNKDPKKLGEIRRNELKSSAEILGVKEVVFLNFKDGDLNNNNYHFVTTELKKILDKTKPDTIMTFDINGVSGHLDHVAVAMECSYLFERLKYIKHILYFCNSATEKKLVGKNYFVYLPEGINPNDADWKLELKDHFNTKKKAMMAHKSQRKDAVWLLTVFRKYLKTELFKINSK
jgi:LmbE family N-acetylglucosaminyl deacetylase